MKKLLFSAFVAYLSLTCALTGCQQKSDAKLIEKVFVVDIVSDSSKLMEYLDHHKHIWPEVEAGFKKAGYKKIALYHYGHHLVMTVTVPEGADLDEMGKEAEAYSPRCAEWNKIMNKYQVGVSGTAPGQTWVEAQPFFSFINE